MSDGKLRNAVTLDLTEDELRTIAVHASEETDTVTALRALLRDVGLREGIVWDPPSGEPVGKVDLQKFKDSIESVAKKMPDYFSISPELMRKMRNPQ